MNYKTSSLFLHECVVIPTDSIHIQDPQTTEVKTGITPNIDIWLS